jgi:hypothetical protein
MRGRACSMRMQAAPAAPSGLHPSARPEACMSASGPPPGVLAGSGPSPAIRRLLTRNHPSQQDSRQLRPLALESCAFLRRMLCRLVSGPPLRLAPSATRRLLRRVAPSTPPLPRPSTTPRTCRPRSCRTPVARVVCASTRPHGLQPACPPPVFRPARLASSSPRRRFRRRRALPAEHSASRTATQQRLAAEMWSGAWFERARTAGGEGMAVRHALAYALARGHHAPPAPPRLRQRRAAGCARARAGSREQRVF